MLRCWRSGTSTQWRHFVDGDSPERRLRLLLARANHRAVPTVFVAVDGTQLLGSATLAEFDMETRRDLTPWMVDVFVAPEFRRRGIASALVKRVVREAAELGVGELYLFTTGACARRCTRVWDGRCWRRPTLSGRGAGADVDRAEIARRGEISRLTILYRRG